MFKKGAMFGLCRAFKKESGRLFLASRQSVGSQETRDSFKTNRGAMFGLDARIALAIFGALSVISGAALYSAIQSANAEAWRQNFNEIAKASEAYYLDTGSALTYTNSGYVANIGELISNIESRSGWKGPYIDGRLRSVSSIYDSNSSKISTISYMVMYLAYSDTWTSGTDSAPNRCTNKTKACSEWIGLYAGNASHSAKVKAVFDLLDSVIDNGDGALDGDIRFNTVDDDYLFVKGITRTSGSY